MRAVVLHRHGAPQDVVGVEDVPAPEPSPGRVRVRVGAAALNLPDVMLCRGEYPLDPGFPFTPGLEAAGEVVALGEGVDGELLGRRVVSTPELPHGALAEECLVPADRAHLVPDGVDDSTAAASHIAFETAFLALHHRGALQGEETLLVHGAAGGVGSAAVQLGDRAGARVVAVVGGAEKAALCRELGAAEVVDHREHDVAEAVLAATDGRGADVVLDPVGGAATEASRRCVARDGRILVVGFASGDAPTLPAGEVLFRSYSVVGVYVGAYSRDPEGLSLVRRVNETILRSLERGETRAVIDRRIGLEGVASALTELGERRVLGKVVVEP